MAGPAARPALGTRLAKTARQQIRAAAREFLDLLYPPRCPGCGRVGELFCSACRQLVQPYPTSCCPRCGRPGAERSLCAACAAFHSPLVAVLPATIFSHPIRETIHDFKYEGATGLAEPLADWLIATWRLHRVHVDLIVPVPLHARRKAERGYNQSELLARRLSEATSVPVARASLVRAVRTRPQVGLTLEQRRANIAGAFRCAGGVTDLRVALVDDVCTTGATLEACAAALQAAGAGEIWGLTVARPSFEASSAQVPRDDTALRE